MIELVGGVLHQWETGRCVNIFGDKVQEANEIQFANANDSVAVAVPHRVTMEYDGPEVQIPDRYLQSGKPLIVYVVTTSNAGNQYRSEILETKVFPVKAKPKPKDYVPTAAEEAYGVVKKLSDEAKAAAEQAISSEETTGYYLIAAEGEASRAEEAADRAEEAANTLIPVEVTVSNGKASFSALEINDMAVDRQYVFLNVGYIIPLTTATSLYALFLEFVESEFAFKAHVIDTLGNYSVRKWCFARIDDEGFLAIGDMHQGVHFTIYAYDSEYPTFVFSSGGSDVVLRGILAGNNDSEAVNVAQLNAVHTTVAEHERKIDTVETKLQNAEESISYAEHSIEDLSDRMGSAERNLTELSVGLDDVEQSFAAAETNIKALEAVVEDAATEIKTKAEIDDSKVGSDAWSSKNVVDKLCPSFTKTGTVVQCEPVEGYPLTVTAEAASLNVTVCGKNLYNAEVYPLEAVGYVNRNSGKFYENSDSSYRFTKKAIPVSHLQGQTISIRNAPAITNGSSTNAGIAFYDADDIGISNAGTQADNVKVPENACYMRFSINKNYVNEAQIELGSTVTDYEPYWERKATGDESAVVLAGKGVNTVIGYDGEQLVEITVSGSADPVAIIENLTNAVLSLGGNI